MAADWDDHRKRAGGFGSVEWTNHALAKLEERVDAKYIASPSRVWRRGESVEIPSEAPVPDHDEARYDAGHDIVLFRVGSRITTVYGLQPEHLTNIHGVAVAAAVDRQHGTTYRRSIDPARLEVIRPEAERFVIAPSDS